MNSSVDVAIIGLHSISRDSNDKGYGGHVGVHNKERNYNSIDLLLYTNMAVVKSYANQQFRTLCFVGDSNLAGIYVESTPSLNLLADTCKLVSVIQQVLKCYISMPFKSFYINSKQKL